MAVVDELAHTNAPGSVHQKRYEDVLDLLAAGIDVISAVNIQHIESLNDAIASTTGVRVRETIPDWVLKRADEVVNVDVSIDTLRDRLRQGKIYDATEDRPGPQQLLPQGQSDGASRAGAPSAGHRSGGQVGCVSRPGRARAAGHSGEGDGRDRVTRQREDIVARRARGSPGVWRRTGLPSTSRRRRRSAGRIKPEDHVALADNIRFAKQLGAKVVKLKARASPTRSSSSPSAKGLPTSSSDSRRARAGTC